MTVPAQVLTVTNFRYWIERVLEAPGVSQTSLEDADVIRRSQLSTWRNTNGVASKKTVKLICDFVGTDYEQTLRFINAEPGQRMPLIRGRPEPLPTEDTATIPQFDAASAARTDQRSDEVQGQAIVPAGPAKRFSVRVDGDCMSPTLPDGCHVVCDFGDYEANKIRSGRIYWVRFDNDESTIKRVAVNGRNLQFTCDNPGHTGFRRSATSVTAAALVIQMITDVR